MLRVLNWFELVSGVLPNKPTRMFEDVFMGPG